MSNCLARTNADTCRQTRRSCESLREGETEFVIVGVDDSLECCLGAEVEEEAYFEGGAADVVDQLFAVGLVDERGGLRFDDNAIGDDEIGAEGPHAHPVLPYLYRDLSLVRNARAGELVREGVAVHRLEETKPKPVVDPIEAPQHLRCSLAVQQGRPGSISQCSSPCSSARCPCKSVLTSHSSHRRTYSSVTIRRRGQR
jgi:hypothetical protein